MSFFAHSFVIASALVVGPALALSQSTAQEGEITLVVTAPWADAASIVDESGGRLVGPVRANMGILAISERDDFLSNLKANGALFVVDGTIIASICGVSL